MNYLEYLRSNHEIVQSEIEDCLAKYLSQPVGSGYIDIITHFKLIENLILELTTIGIIIDGVTWWCHCSEENKRLYGCPHGMGGPQSVFYEGWYSEMGIDYESAEIPQAIYDKLEKGKVSSDDIKAMNDIIKDYIDEFSKDERFSKCFTPAVWLHVPKEWNRIKYLKRNI